MIYSEQGRVLFAHISRTAGVAITEFLRRQFSDATPLLGQHDPLVAARSMLGDGFDQAFKFAIVRNPWDRFVSWYALIGQTIHRDRDEQATLGEPDSEHWTGFDAFLETWAAEEILIDGTVRRKLSQWAHLVDADGLMLTDDVGRFETLTDDLARLYGKMGVFCPGLPVINASVHRHYSLYYSSFGRELVGHLFCEDVEQFGYRFENAIGEADAGTFA